MSAGVRIPAALAGLALLWGGLPALANCADEIAQMEKSVDQQDANAIASNSGGQKDAGARGASTQVAKKKDVPVESTANPDAGGSVGDTKAAAAAGAGGADVMSAKVALNDAKNAAKKGDEKACNDALARAKAAHKS